jgi:hypothetical protein
MAASRRHAPLTQSPPPGTVPPPLAPQPAASQIFNKLTNYPINPLTDVPMPNFKFLVLFSRPVFEIKVNQTKSRYLKVNQGKIFFEKWVGCQFAPPPPALI